MSTMSIDLSTPEHLAKRLEQDILRRGSYAGSKILVHAPGRSAIRRQPLDGCPGDATVGRPGKARASRPERNLRRTCRSGRQIVQSQSRLRADARRAGQLFGCSLGFADRFPLPSGSRSRRGARAIQCSVFVPAQGRRSSVRKAAPRADEVELGVVRRRCHQLLSGDLSLSASAGSSARRPGVAGP